MKIINKSNKRDFVTYLMVIVAYIVLLFAKNANILNRSQKGMLIPICCYIVMAISLNLTVGIMGDLSLGHAGFMSVGCFSGVIFAMCFYGRIPNGINLILSMLVGAFFAAFIGFLIGIPVLRLRGDYLAIVTLAFGEIIKEIINCLIVGHDSNGLHIIVNVKGTSATADLNLLSDGRAIVKGAQGATGTDTFATFTAGFILIMICLIIILNFVRSRTGRAVMAIRDNAIAAESCGINITKYKMITFVLSAAMAGSAGALYGLNYSTITAAKFDFNTSILILVFVVLGGLGNIRGSIVAATVLYILPEMLRAFSTYRMLIYAIILIVVMLSTNNPKMKNLFSKILPKKGVLNK